MGPASNTLAAAGMPPPHTQHGATAHTAVTTALTGTDASPRTPFGAAGFLPCSPTINTNFCRLREITIQSELLFPSFQGCTFSSVATGGRARPRGLYDTVHLRSSFPQLSIPPFGFGPSRTQYTQHTSVIYSPLCSLPCPLFSPSQIPILFSHNPPTPSTEQTCKRFRTVPPGNLF